MATAWEILTGNSTLPVLNTAWDHLNNQEGGGSGVDNYYQYIAVEAEMSDIEIVVEEQAIIILVEDPRIEIVAEESEYEIEVE